jgi:hypothetical protein
MVLNGAGMNLYPLNLVLAVALAAATLFIGYLPARRLTARFFTRWTLRFGGMWLAVAALTPPEILHYYVLLALVCFIAWWRLRGGHGLGGKFWLCLAAGFGLSLAPVLIFAVTPRAWPDALPAWSQALFLASLYTGGAIPGIALALWIFTRREASEAGMHIGALARMPIVLVVVRAACALLGILAMVLIRPGASGLYLEFAYMAMALDILVLLPAALLASKRIKSPRPSTAGMALSILVVFGIAAEVLSLI